MDWLIEAKDFIDLRNIIIIGSLVGWIIIFREIAKGIVFFGKDFWKTLRGEHNFLIKLIVMIFDLFMFCILFFIIFMLTLYFLNEVGNAYEINTYTKRF